MEFQENSLVNNFVETETRRVINNGEVPSKYGHKENSKKNLKWGKDNSNYFMGKILSL